MAARTAELGARTQEASPLLAADTDEAPVVQLGIDINEDTRKAHWVMVLPHKKIVEDAAGYAQAQPNAEVLWKKIFPESDVAPPPGNLSSMSKKDFHEAVRQTLIDIFQGEHCGFTCTAYKSANGANVMLRVLLARENAKKVIAEHEDHRIPLRPDSYKDYGFESPTVEYKEGHFIAGEKETPGHLCYSRKLESILKPEFKEVDCVRLLRRRIATLVNVDELIAAGVASDFFPAHNYKYLDFMHTEGWNNWKNIFQWPGTYYNNYVRDYFGEEFGFFFHWLNFFTRYLVAAGVLGGIVAIIEYGILPDDDPGEDIPRSAELLSWPKGDYPRSYVRLMFSIFMCLWGAVYTKHYQRRSNFLIMEWGMKDYAAHAQVRTQYDKEYRGTPKDQLQRAAHWLLVLLFIVETFVVVWLVCLFRRDYLSKQETFFGMKGETAMKLLPNLMITANIKFVDQLWKRLSPVLTRMENWRTDQEMKDSMVIKMFIVKFIVYYYPFWFIAFLQESWYGADPDECMEDLRQQIYVYFPIEVSFTIGMTIFTLLQAKALILLRSGEDKTAKLRHTELQASCPAYEDGIEDTMELILSFGFLMMFSTILVIMPLLALVANLVQLKMLAFRLSFANRRPSPRGQEGFGAWADIVQIITFAGILCNVGLAVFVMNPLRNLPLPHKLTWLILFEHILLAVKLFITIACPGVSDNQKLIDEHNSAVVPVIQFRCIRDAGKKQRAADRASSTKRTSKTNVEDDDDDLINVDDDIPKIDLKFSTYQ